MPANVVTLEDFRPSPRYDGIPWTQARIEEGTASTGPFATLETKTLSPVDADPSNPAYRNFTTELGTEGRWYRVVFLDATGDFALPTFPVQNVADTRPVYASPSELALLVRVTNPASRHASLMRVLKTASDEVDHEIGTADINGVATPYSNPPPVAREVCLERAVEHWKQEQSPFGIIGLGGGELVATYTARDSWDRHAHKLAILKNDWGMA